MKYSTYQRKGYSPEMRRQLGSGEDLPGAEPPPPPSPLMLSMRKVKKMKRNDRCSCGSGKKYKVCCKGREL